MILSALCQSLVDPSMPNWSQEEAREKKPSRLEEWQFLPITSLNKKAMMT